MEHWADMVLTYQPSPAHGPSHRAPSPYLGPLLTATPSQRWARVQPRAENSPTVAAEPGENLPSQKRPKKDVFPTEELPTNTILKSRSGVDREPSFCGRQTVGSTTGQSPVPAPATPTPHCPYGVQGETSNQQGRLLQLRPRTQEASGSGHRGSFQHQMWEERHAFQHH